ncbi:hypothetical protein ABRG53_3328 [Pseudanabaena sp. ABRG5-3]|nr:hypothetical protein ABRG53_3328 [Pseudanabaena sp. ABRG5-3]
MIVLVINLVSLLHAPLSYSKAILLSSILNITSRRIDRKSEIDENNQRQLLLADNQHNNRLGQLDREHSHRLEQQQQTSNLRKEELSQQHNNRLVEQTQMSWLRCREIAVTKYLDAQLQERGHILRKQERETEHLYRLEEMELSHEFQIYRDSLIRSLSHEHSQELESLRSSYQVQVNAINRYLQKTEENSPFREPTSATIEKIRSRYIVNKKPLVLISPFWSDKLKDRDNLEGGFQNFRAAILSTWNKVPWVNDVVRCDGYLRPLIYTDMDVDDIASALGDLPVILVYGMIQGGEEVHPAIAIWNILPEQKGNYFHLNIDSFSIPVNQSGSKVESTNPVNQSESKGESANPINQSVSKVEFANSVGHYLTTIIGILSDVYQLSLTGKRPDLKQYAPNDPEKLKFLASEFNYYYDLISYQQPLQEHFFRLDQAIMLYECGLVNEANNQVKSAYESWYYQKTQNSRLLEIVNSEVISLLTEFADNNDYQFVKKLIEFYRFTDNRQQTEQLLQLLDNLQPPKQYKPIARFQR